VEGIVSDLIPLPAHQIPDRFYRGGARIDAFRGVAPGPDYRPEDWIGSATPLAGEESLGLSTLPDGRRLADAIAGDTAAWLGAAHRDAFGPSTMMLVKLLDAGQRLPVHAHPDDDFAREVLGTANGKAEAWYILSPGTVHLGLTRTLTAAELAGMVASQDVSGLLGALHRREVAAGDTVLVPPGELHAIGAGILLLEIQQPADLSILVEWAGFRLDGERDGHLGLGFDVALGAVTRRARSDAEVDAWIRRGPLVGSALAPAADAWFRMERVVVAGPAELERGLAILVVEDGPLLLEPAAGAALSVDRGATVLAPFDAGAIRATGSGSVLVCRPPAPHRG
jgi:mannose-6-phosphate isomerase